MKKINKHNSNATVGIYQIIYQINCLQIENVYVGGGEISSDVKAHIYKHTQNRLVFGQTLYHVFIEKM